MGIILCIILLILFFIYLNSLKEPFYNTCTDTDNIKLIRIHILNTENVNNYLDEEYANRSIINILNTNDKTTNYRLDKIINTDYKNNLYNNYNYVKEDQVATSNNVDPKTKIDKFVSNDINTFNADANFDSDNSFLLLKMIDKHDLDDNNQNKPNTTTMHLIFIPYLELKNTKYIETNNTNICVLGLYNNKKDRSEILPRIPYSYQNTWMNDYKSNEVRKNELTKDKGSLQTESATLNENMKVLEKLYSDIKISSKDTENEINEQKKSLNTVSYEIQSLSEKNNPSRVKYLKDKIKYEFVTNSAGETIETKKYISRQDQYNTIMDANKGKLLESIVKKNNKYDKLKNEIKDLENELETEIKDKIKTHNDKHNDLFIPDFKELDKKLMDYYNLPPENCIKKEQNKKLLRKISKNIEDKKEYYDIYNKLYNKIKVVGSTSTPMTKNDDINNKCNYTFTVHCDKSLCEDSKHYMYDSQVTSPSIYIYEHVPTDFKDSNYEELLQDSKDYAPTSNSCQTTSTNELTNLWSTPNNSDQKNIFYYINKTPLNTNNDYYLNEFSNSYI